METDIRHGSRIGRFVVTGELGAGGMGVVYAAHDPELDRRVALKVLRTAGATEEDRLRMLREGQAMARVTHPNVITVYEVGVQGNLVFLAQELLDGGSLGDWLEQPHPQAETIAKFCAAGRGLAAAHAAGLAHRDFKPDNVLLGKDGRIRVSDFGLARALGPTDEVLPAATRANMARAQLEAAASGPMSPLTRTGAVLGTPMFMAPEQHNGEVADARSDQFSFAVALYHALYGAYPFTGKTAVALADAVIDGRMEKPPSGANVSPRLRAILLRGLARKPTERYPTMDALIAELERPPSHKLRNTVIVLASLGLAAVAVFGGYALRTHDEAVHRPPLTAFDPKTLTNRHGIEWMTAAIDRDQLDEAIEKYDMAGALAQQSNEAVHASIALSSGALVHALRGHLDLARAHLASAEAAKGNDPTAIAYADLAATAVALAAGQLDDAAARGKQCASELATAAPELAAMCHGMRGDAAAQHGDAAAARAAYREGLALVKRPELALALAMLDLDANKPDAAIGEAAPLRTDASQVLVARAHLAQAESQQALADLEHVNIDAIESFATAIAARIARGQATALLGDTEGLDQLDAARVSAEKAGFVGLALEARLARVTTMIVTAAPEAAAAQKALVADARGRGYVRIAHLAETIAQR